MIVCLAKSENGPRKWVLIQLDGSFGCIKIILSIFSFDNVWVKGFFEIGNSFRTTWQKLPVDTSVAFDNSILFNILARGFDKRLSNAAVFPSSSHKTSGSSELATRAIISTMITVRVVSKRSFLLRKNRCSRFRQWCQMQSICNLLIHYFTWEMAPQSTKEWSASLVSFRITRAFFIQPDLSGLNGEYPELMHQSFTQDHSSLTASSIFACRLIFWL